MQDGYDNGRGGQMGEFVLGRQDSHLELSPIPARGNDLERENLELRKALNTQVRQNRDLLERVRFLENENWDLRNQLGLPIPKRLVSTQYTQNYNEPSSFVGLRSSMPSQAPIHGRRAP